MMHVVFWSSIFWIIYGIIGLFGFQYAIPKQFRGQPWEKTYIRKQGFSWLIMGIPWLIFYLLTHNNRLEFSYELIILIASALPSLIYIFVVDRKYKTLIKNNNK